MTECMYRFLERHQKLDALIGKARQRPHVNLWEVAWLKRQKQNLTQHWLQSLRPVSSIA